MRFHQSSFAQDFQMTGYRWLGKIEGDGEFGHSVGTGSEFVEKKNSFRISQRLTDSVMEKTDFIFQNTTHLNFPSVGTGGMQYFRFSPTTMPFHMNKPTYMGHYKPMIHERATLVHVFHRLSKVATQRTGYKSVLIYEAQCYYSFFARRIISIRDQLYVTPARTGWPR